MNNPCFYLCYPSSGVEFYNNSNNFGYVIIVLKTCSFRGFRIFRAIDFDELLIKLSNLTLILSLKSTSHQLLITGCVDGLVESGVVCADNLLWV